MALVALDPAPREVIVVADGDPWAARLAQRHGFRSLDLSGPRGPSHARNQGAAAARGSVLIFVDADVEVPPDFLIPPAELFASQPQVAAIMGSYDDAPGETNFLSQYRNLLHHWVHQNSSQRATTFWAACGAIKKEAFWAVGGFDSVWESIEDVELGRRLYQADRCLVLHKSWQVKHLKRWGPWTLLKTDFWGRALPWTRLILRQAQIPNDLNLTWRARASVALSWLLLALLILAPLWPLLLGPAAVAMILLLVLNQGFYRFLLKRRGGLFTFKALAWHWLYHLYSGLALGLGLCEHLWWRLRWILKGDKKADQACSP